jgi:DHA1 family bicyclomycin/chloramphenicol resistance-like MFS transporter
MNESLIAELGCFRYSRPMKKHRSKQENFFLILLLGMLTALGPFSIDMYLPSFPEIAADLHSTVGEVALSLSSFFIGISVGQLIYGPVLDRYGRKKPLYFGLALYCLASIGCIFVKTIDALVVLRFIQALGSCAAAVGSIAMVRDFFPVKDSAKVFALLMLVVGLSPMVAPTVGGYVTAAFGWQSVFATLLLITIAIFIAVVFWLPHGHEPDTRISLKPRPIFKNYWQVLKEPAFFTYTMTGAVGFSALFAYVAGSSFVFMNLYHVDAKVYGWIFALLSVGFIGASQVNSLLLKKFSSKGIAFWALALQSAIGAIFLILVLNQALSLAGMVIALFAFLCCVGFVGPNTSALALAPFERNAGTASALMGALQMGFGSVISIALGLMNPTTAVPMVSLMEAAAVLAFATLVLGRRRITSEGH